jgi:ABC-2 type transport system ATP-binding protein
MAVIDVKNLTKSFRVPIKGQKGFRSLFFRKEKTIEVIKKISFSIEEGEFIGYIGPNGAGKSTTIKLLTGILHPTSGSVSVLNYEPFKQRYEYTQHIGVVFGQRSLLEYDIPVIDSLILYKAIYGLDDDFFEERLQQFTKMLNLEELLHIPVRKLSLGQRVRCEIAASLLHKPKIIFLDEPTIGLDALAKHEIREFLRKVNKEEKVTIILTTHDMDDIEALCDRILFIDNGKIIYDGTLKDLKKKYAPHKDVEVVFDDEINVPKKFSDVLESSHGTSYTFRLKREEVTEKVGELMKLGKPHDIIIHELDLEEVVKIIYRKKDV